MCYTVGCMLYIGLSSVQPAVCFTEGCQVCNLPGVIQRDIVIQRVIQYMACWVLHRGLYIIQRAVCYRQGYPLYNIPCVIQVAVCYTERCTL